MLLLFVAIAPFLHFVSAGDCEFEQEGYRLQWKPFPNKMTFTLEVTPTGSLESYWTGVAFGKSMSKLDFVLVTGDGTTITVKDAHTNGYGPPQIDSQQDIDVIYTGYESGKLKVVFERPLDTGDEFDMVIDPNSFMLQLPVKEGPLEGTTVRKHSETPVSYVTAGTCPGAAGAAEPGPEPVQGGAGEHFPNDGHDHGDGAPEPEPEHTPGDGHDHGHAEPESEPTAGRRNEVPAGESEPSSAKILIVSNMCVVLGMMVTSLFSV